MQDLQRILPPRGRAVHKECNHNSLSSDSFAGCHQFIEPLVLFTFDYIALSYAYILELSR